MLFLNKTTVDSIVADFSSVIDKLDKLVGERQGQLNAIAAKTSELETEKVIHESQIDRALKIKAKLEKLLA